MSWVIILANEFDLFAERHSDMKSHRDDSGFVVERENHLVKDFKVVVYVSSEQGIDVDGNKYAIVCDAHGTLCGTDILRDARSFMCNPDSFCEDCQRINEMSKELPIEEI